MAAAASSACEERGSAHRGSAKAPGADSSIPVMVSEREMRSPQPRSLAAINSHGAWQAHPQTTSARESERVPLAAASELFARSRDSGASTFHYLVALLQDRAVVTVLVNVVRVARLARQRVARGLSQHKRLVDVAVEQRHRRVPRARQPCGCQRAVQLLQHRV